MIGARGGKPKQEYCSNCDCKQCVQFRDEYFASRCPHRRTFKFGNKVGCLDCERWIPQVSNVG
jgi:hypothetical protein